MTNILVKTSRRVFCFGCGNQVYDFYFLDQESVYSIAAESQLVCKYCFNYYLCSECKHICRCVYSIALDSNTTKRVCNACASSLGFCCFRCGSVYGPLHLITIPDEHISMELMVAAGLTRVAQPLCSYCYNDYFINCSICNRTYLVNDRSNSHRKFCKHCDVILEYDANVLTSTEQEFYHYSKEILYGIELEVEISGSDEIRRKLVLAKEVMDLSEDPAWLKIKHDGSLDFGFELVTKPSTVDEHRRRWRELLPKLPDCIFTASTCGLHVHVSRRPLSKLQIGKMLVLVNNPEIRRYIVTISGRESADYARLEEKEFRYVNNGDHEKYEAVSLSHNDTVEFRIFKATKVYNTLMYRLEFVQAIVDYTAPGNISVASVSSWKDFCDFVSKERKTYKCLYRFFVTQSFLKEERRKVCASQSSSQRA